MAITVDARPAGDPPKELPGLHNVHQATPRVLLGSEPAGEEAFEALQNLGVTTIVSVDGARPDVHLARKYGLRYIHIPIGYDGVPAEASQMLSRVAREVEGPVYVHCHHGKHRGPAAAAVLCLSSGSLTKEQARSLMKKAGTGSDYTGLWRDVADYEPWPDDLELPELVEVAAVESVPAAMAALDRHFDHLKLCAKADWKAPVDHPDLVPAAEALLVQEGLTESLRHLPPDAPEELKNWLAESASSASRLQTLLSADKPVTDNRREAEELLKALEQSCTTCHRKYRNQ